MSDEDELARAEAEIKRLMGLLDSEEMDVLIQRERAERAEARIAEFADKGTLQALRDANDRMERAEAECVLLKEHVRCVINERELATDMLRSAEAERDELREAARPVLDFYCDYLDNDENGDPRTNRHVARLRAALNPSPAET